MLKLKLKHFYGLYIQMRMVNRKMSDMKILGILKREHKSKRETKQFKKRKNNHGKTGVPITS